MKLATLAIPLLISMSACQNPYRGFDLDPSAAAETSCAKRHFSAIRGIARDYAVEKSLQFRENPLGPVITLTGTRYHFLIDGAGDQAQLTQFMRSGISRNRADDSDFQNLLARLNACEAPR